jgi:hypothetical protein
MQETTMRRAVAERGRRALALLLMLAPSLPASAQQVPAEYQGVMTALGRAGDFKDGVLKIGLPRTDLAMTVAGVSLPTPFGFSGWIAMTRGDGGMDVMMGDLVLTEDQVNPVMSALLDNGLEVSALHNHFLWEQPRIFYMHLHGHGLAADLARRVRPALDLISKAAAAMSDAPTGAAVGGGGTQITPEPLVKAIGHAGDQSGSVYKITIGRPDITLVEMGAPIGVRMGLNTWAAFAGSDQDAVVAGDVAMLETEVTPVLRALRKAGLEVVAIHHHMTGSRPVVIFLHYWGRGPALTLARGVRAALDELGRRARSPMRP